MSDIDFLLAGQEQSSGFGFLGILGILIFIIFIIIMVSGIIFYVISISDEEKTEILVESEEAEEDADADADAEADAIPEGSDNILGISDPMVNGPMVSDTSIQSLGGTADSIITEPKIETRLKFICEGKTGSISCPVGKTIKIVSSSYGRLHDGSPCILGTDVNAGFNKCSGHDKCKQRDAFGNKICLVKTNLDRCNGKQSCSNILSNNGAYGDLCPGVFKNHSIEYQCV